MSDVQKRLNRFVEDKFFTVETLSQSNPREYIIKKARDKFYPITRVEEKRLFGFIVWRKEIRELK